MKRVGKLSATTSLAAFAALLLAVPVSAADPVQEVQGTTSTRLISWGPLEAKVGIKIPKDATILKIIVETFDDYDLVGASPTTDRVKANQKHEQVYIEIGGDKIGKNTDDIPEIGAGGNRRAASITTVVFEGEKKVDGGDVTVNHLGNKSSPNSLQIRKVTIFFRAAGSGGNYPPGPGGVGDDDDEDDDDEEEVDDEDDEDDDEDDEDEDEDDEDDDEEVGSNSQSASTSTSSTTTTTTAAPKTASQAVLPTTTSTTSTTTTTTTIKPVIEPEIEIEPEVLSSGITASGSSGGSTAVGSASAIPGTLPVTGSDSFDIVQLSGVIAVAGVGLVTVAGVRRRKVNLRSR